MNDTKNVLDGIADEMATAMGEIAGNSAGAKAARRTRTRNRAEVPSSEDPMAEIRRLMMQHRALTKASVAITNMASDKRSRATGEPIACLLPLDSQSELKAVAELQTKRAKSLESRIERELRKLPIYQLFMRHIFGLGPVVCGYLVSELDMNKAVKPSNVIRYCGLAVIDGRLERAARRQDWMPADYCRARKPHPIAKPKDIDSVRVVDGVEQWFVWLPSAYNANMRTRLFQGMGAMWRNRAKKSAERPNGSTSKYLDVWTNYKNRMSQSERFNSVKNTIMPLDGAKPRSGARGFIHSTGWHKAACVLLEDIYIVWRAIEGLPVWPSYYAAKLGYTHKDGKISVNAPKLLTVDEALELVGYVGPMPAAAPAEPDGIEDVEVEEEED